ncbi:YARHG domain-containing protein [Sporosarcina sp. GW1-11]|uniref:YARHG domain-containing protein n=1 Tax=Sporosarcina sp. GW1-11 TaxID=2899126 RepID=UPI00294CB4F6|nr:YARHG domain-containing protein [Sporosarcina sp. GW1-11]MDV6378187.1 YARHG domain-containing protein [Sporosarcina sp. GW1-11]
MRKCLTCQEMNPEKEEFCMNCGAFLSFRRASVKKSFIQRPPLYQMVLAIVIIGGFFGYYAMQTEYGKEAVAEQFITALITQDTNTLNELIVPKDSRITVDKDSLQALLALIEKNPSTVQTIENNLMEQNKGMFSMRASGKRLGLFPLYTINPTGYIVEVESIGDETILSTENSEIGYIKKRGETAEFGPFLAGIYPIKMTTIIDGETISEEIQANIFGENHAISLFFPSVEEVALIAKQSNGQDASITNKAESSTENDTPVGKIYNDYFILPTSGDTYLKASDLKGLSKSDLRLARNEIYARYGYIFKSKELQAYFDSQTWYVPNDAYGGSLTEWEKHNVALIKSKE